MFPAQGFAGQGNFVVTQRSAVAIFFALLVGRAKTNDGLAADQRGLFGVGASLFKGSANGVGIMPVNGGDHLPAIGFETLRRVIGKPAFDFTIDGDAVVIIEKHQLAQAQSAGQEATSWEMPSIRQPSPRNA